MGAFEGADDALLAREQDERIERGLVLAADIFGAADVLQMGMFGADARVIEPGRDRPAFGDLAVGILEEEGRGAVEDAGRTAQDRRAMFVPVEPLAGGFDPDQADPLVGDEIGEDADRIRPAADAGDDRVGQAALDLEDLLARFLADHALKFADHQREGVRPGGGAEDIVGVGEAGGPVAQCLVDRVLEGLRARHDGDDGRAHQLHAEDVQ